MADYLRYDLLTTIAFFGVSYQGRRQLDTSGPGSRHEGAAPRPTSSAGRTPPGCARPGFHRPRASPCRGTTPSWPTLVALSGDVRPAGRRTDDRPRRGWRESRHRGPRQPELSWHSTARRAELGAAAPRGQSERPDQRGHVNANAFRVPGWLRPPWPPASIGRSLDGLQLLRVAGSSSVGSIDPVVRPTVA